jgi:hypothetical protein
VTIVTDCSLKAILKGPTVSGPKVPTNPLDLRVVLDLPFTFLRLTSRSLELFMNFSPPTMHLQDLELTQSKKVEESAYFPVGEMPVNGGRLVRDPFDASVFYLQDERKIFKVDFTR